MDPALLPIVACMLAIFFLPGIMASKRKHHNSGAIWLLNILLGWTFLGWIIALIWAMTSRPPAERTA